MLMCLLRISHDAMVNLTISLSEDTVRRLRKIVQETYGGKKGAISGLIEDSLRERLEELGMPRPSQIFYAKRNDRVLAEAETLDELALKLRKLDVDPRSVRIASSRKLSPTVRTGIRGRKI